MAVKKSQHVHKYKRVKIKNSFVVYRCMLPDCPHWIFPDLLPNRKSICKCGKEFIISMECSKLAEPKCDDCRAERSHIIHPPRPGERKYVDKDKIISDILKDFGLDEVLSQGDEVSEE
jgi:hypothetical protein